MPVVERVYKVNSYAELEKRVKEFEEKAAKEKITKESLEEMKAMNKALNDTLALAVSQGIVDDVDRADLEKRVYAGYLYYLDNQKRDENVKYMSGAEWDAKIEYRKVQEAYHKQEEARAKQNQKSQTNTNKASKSDDFERGQG